MLLFFPIGIILLRTFGIISGVAPTIDLSHNMRILKLPKDTPVGSIIYRLRGSDADNDVLTFGVRGEVANNVFEIRAASETRANVILKAEPQENEYQFTVYVTDGTQTTEVESTVMITNSTNSRSPFIDYSSLISVSEFADENDVISTLIVRKRNSSSLPVLFELNGSDKFAVKYVISPLKEASKAEISLVQKLDYERQNLFRLTIYALNPWTDEAYDTRNIATVDLLVAVKDEQDTPPIFSSLPPVIRVSDSLNLGDNVTRIVAEDGDYGNQRNVTYSFVTGSQGLSYFNINSRTGMITLASTMERLRESYSTTGPFVLNVQASEIETAENPGEPMSTEAFVAIVLVNTENRPPRFFNRRYVGSVMENSPELTSITWEGPVLPKVMDDDQGKNGSFEVFLEGDDGVFSVQPSRGMNELTFAVLVKEPKGLDYESSDTKYLEFRIIARETASIRPLSATAEIRVKLIDANDNIPHFSQSVYNVTLPEDASPGFVLIKIQATDEDTDSYGMVRYTAVNGPIAGNLRLDTISGELTLLSADGLDRERVPEYRLTVEARDDQGKGNRNTAEVHVFLADANDNAPVFLQPRYDGVLNPDMRNFYERLQVQAYDADGPGPNSDITYEIVNGNYQEKFLIDPRSGEITLREPLVTGADAQEHGLPVITLTVRAHDQGVPVRFNTVKVQVHNQEYLNRSISFIVPLSARRASSRKQELERGFSALTGAHVNVHSVAFHNTSSEKSVVRCWVSYPLSSTVDLTNMDVIISNIFGRDYHIASSQVEAMSRGNFDVVFWLLIALVILMILAIIALCFYCCCVRTPEGFLEMKNKIAPEESIVTYKEDGASKGDQDVRRRSNSVVREAWSAKRPQKVAQRSYSAVDVDVQTNGHQTASVQVSRNGPQAAATTFRQEDGLPRDFYPNGRMARVYQQGRPLSPNTEMLLQDIGAQDVRRVGDYMVVRKVIRPTVRVHPGDGTSDQASDSAPQGTEILYIRSPLREEDEDRVYERVRVADGEPLRSVSETALNVDTHDTLRVPRAVRPRLADYRNEQLERSEGPREPLKFSRYHRTDSDVYLTSDGQVVLGPQEIGHHPSQTFREEHHHPHFAAQVDRTGRPVWPERWEAEDLYQRQGPRYVRPDPDYGSIERLRHPQIPQQLSPALLQTSQVLHVPQQHHPLFPQQQQHPDRAPYHQRSHLQEDNRQTLESVLRTVRGPDLPLTTTQQQVHQAPMQQQETSYQTRRQSLATREQDGEPSQDTDEYAVVRKRSDDQTQDDESKAKPESPDKDNTADDDQPGPSQEQPADFFDLTAHLRRKKLTMNDSSVESEEGPQAEPEPATQDPQTEDEQERPQTAILNSRENEDRGRLEDDNQPGDGAQDQAEHDGDAERTTLRATTEDDRTDQNPGTDLDGEDSDSGIGKDSSGLRLKKANLMEKKSLFTIAYDGMQTRGLKSAGGRDDSP